MTPADLLEELKQGVTNRTAITLDAIYEVCTEQLERGIHDFSIATIARLGTKRGVPRAQSLRNKTGERYRALIQSFADNHAVGETKNTAKTKSCSRKRL